MGFAYRTGRNSISESQLPPHMRNQKPRTPGYVGGSEPSVATYRKVLAGADLSLGQAFCIDAAGKAVPAGTLPAFGVAIRACLAGDDCYYAENVDVVNTDWSFTPGAIVWLSPTGVPTTDPPAFADGIIHQELGMALDAHTLAVKIGLGRKVRM